MYMSKIHSRLPLLCPEFMKQGTTEAIDCRPRMQLTYMLEGVAVARVLTYISPMKI